MPFGDEDFHDLVRLLEEHPEWRNELRRLVLIDELLALPEQIADLRVSTEQRFRELAEAQQKLVEAQQRTEKRVTELAEAQQKLVEAQQRTTEQLQALAD